jgi:ABC-type oligopeptide transport system substrate-binding subunit
MSLSINQTHKRRKKKMGIHKKIVILMALFGMGALLRFHTNPKREAGPSAPGAGQTLIVMAGDLEGWDPATVTYYTANDVMQTLYDRLVEYEVVKTADGRMLADGKIKA